MMVDGSIITGQLPYPLIYKGGKSFEKLSKEETEGFLVKMEAVF